MKQMLITLAAFLLLPATAFGQALTPEQTERIESVFSDLAGLDSPGASVAVIQRGVTVYSQGFGSAQIEYGVPVSPQTVFHVASVSKQFTAMAVLLLEADGRLSLDDDIRTHMPEVPDMGAVVTPRHLLRHTSGVRDQWELLAMAGWRLDDVITKVHVRRLLRNQRELNFEPGDEYMYSNMGFSLLADLVERVSGKPFSEFVNKRIFQPLGMSLTHVHDDHQMVVPDRAYSYATTPGGYRNAVLSYANHGATSLFTTAEDLVTWLDNFRLGTIGGSSLLEEMTTRGVLNSGDTIAYAFGLSIGQYRGAKTIGHGGADAGFRSQVLWFPEQETGIAVLSNLASGNPGLRARQIADVVLEHSLDPVPTPVESEATRPEVALDAAILERYVGEFRTSVMVMEFETRDGALWLIAPGEARLRATAENVFEPDGVEASVTFHVRGGVADSLTFVQSGQSLEGSRVTESGPQDLSPFLGTYYSPEIETLYEVRAGEDGLAVYHLRFGEVPLLRSGNEDMFTGSQFFMSQVRFTRDDSGNVDGFSLTGGRVRNLRFEKLTSALPPG